MPERFHLTQVSDNKKTGPIAVTTSSRDLCPGSCPYKAGGCYANTGPLAIHWSMVTKGTRGVTWQRHLQALKALPPKQKIRVNQAGDLGSAKEILELGKVLKGRVAWTYTHHREGSRLAAAREVNKKHGLVINLSANSVAEADRMRWLGSPMVVALREDARPNFKTPGGLRVVACPEQTGQVKNCDTCGNGLPLCARHRSYAIGFYPHGGQASKAAAIAAKENA